MARLWSCGFELQSVTSGVEVDTVTGSPTINTTTKRSGAAALRVYKTSAAMCYAQMRVPNSSALYTRVWLNITTKPSVGTELIAWDNSAGFYAAGVQLQTDGTVRVEYLNSSDVETLVGTASSALDDGNWHCVEFYCKYNSTTSMDYELKVDGTSVWSGTTTDNYNDGVTNYQTGIFGSGSSCTLDIYIDDLAVNDTTGSSQTSWAGNTGKIVHMYPDSAGDINECSSGDVTSVDEQPTPNDATDYVVFDADNDDFLVNCEASSVPGIGASDTITLVQVGYRHTAASAAAWSFTPYIESQASGTQLNGTAFTHNDTTWRTNGDALPRTYKLTSYVDPQAGGAWTPALLNSMQIGGVCTDATPDMWLTSLWALVEYVPAAGGAPVGIPDWPIFTGNKFWGWRYTS